MIKSTVAFTRHSAIQIQDQTDLVHKIKLRSNSKLFKGRVFLIIRRQKMVHKKGSQVEKGIRGRERGFTGRVASQAERLPRQRLHS